MKTIKIAAWSIGEHAQRNILPAFSNTTNTELCGIYTRNAEILKEQSLKYGCRSYASSTEMLNDIDLDAIYISSPNSLHYEQILEALKCGKHVLVEKSALSTIAETKQILDIASKNGLFVMEAFMYHFHQQFEDLKNLIESKKYGPIVFIEASFGFPHLNEGNIRYSKRLSGGALNDAGAYTISAVLNLLGLDSVLEYSLIDTQRGYEVDTSGLAIFKKNKAKAICKWAFGSSYRNDIIIWCEKGHILVERAFSKPPGYESKIQITNNGVSIEEIVSGKDNHFVKMIDCFTEMVMNKVFLSENNKLLSQAIILDKIRNFHV